MKRLTRYLEHREGAIHLLVKRYKNRFSADTIHRLRLEIKKLNAFLHLISFCSDDFKRKKTFNPFKKLFRQAGKVRELQLEKKILKKYQIDNLLNDYSDGLNKLRAVEKETFCSMAKGKRALKLKGKFHDIIRFISRVDGIKAAEYLAEYKCLFDELQTQQSLVPHQVHQIRKWLKEVHYCCKILSIKPQNIPVLNKSYLPSHLGKWHDYDIIINHIKIMIQNGKVNFREIASLDDIIEKLFSERDTLFNNLLTDLSAKTETGVQIRQRVQ